MITLPLSTIAGVDVPQSELISKCLAYISEYNIPSTLHHCVRSAIWCLIIRSKIPEFQDLSPEVIVVVNILHDLGWSLDPRVRSPDKRFEIDGANAARAFLATEAGIIDSTWDQARLQQIWDTIALHSTPSIAFHAQPLVHLTCWGITADFAGPETPGGVITAEEYKEVLKAYPRIGFEGDFQDICCGLCQNKPETTYDNFVSDYGRGRVEGYEEAWSKRRMDVVLSRWLKACKQYEE